MWEVGGGGGRKDAGYSEDANLMHRTSSLGREMRAGFHSDPLLRRIDSIHNLYMRGAVTECHDSLAYTFTYVLMSFYS